MLSTYGGIIMTTLTTRERLLHAAVEAFAEKGFAATTTRDIASRANMSPAAVYVHHSSKESLLYTISLKGHNEALDVIQTAASKSAEPTERLRHMVYDLSLWHGDNSRVGRIVQWEYHALTPEHRAEVAGFRRAIEKIMQDALADGVSKGVFDVRDVPGTAFSLLALGVDLVRWFVPGGSRTSHELATLHADLAVRMTQKVA